MDGYAASKRLRSVFASREELENKKLLMGIQVANLFVVLLTFAIWGIVELINSDFFNYPFWYNTKDFLGSVLNYWPLFVWGGIMASLAYFIRRDNLFHAKEMLAADVGTSILAGVWEEIGFRCIFILTAMIGVWLSNIIFFWVIWISIGILTLLLIANLSKPGLAIVFLILIGIDVFLLWLCWDIDGPVYWLYQRVFFPVINFVTFGQFSDILYSSTVPFLFVAGAVSANAKFRDGHKYQGLIGFVNAWVIGFVMLNATIYHGLVVAIVIHAIYDLEFAFIRFIFSKR